MGYRSTRRTKFEPVLYGMLKSLMSPMYWKHLFYNMAHLRPKTLKAAFKSQNLNMVAMKTSIVPCLERIK